MAKRTDPPDLRPIGARALKSAKDTLRPYLAGANVADLFAGQGRFGTMALDEGADHCTFVENNARTAAALRQALGGRLENAKIIEKDVFAFLKQEPAPPFDVVFLDPPFRQWDPHFAKSLLDATSRVLSAEAIVLVKTPSRMVFSGPFLGLKLWKQSKFGESALAYFRREGA